MLAPQAPMNFNMQMYIVYGGQFVSRLFFYAIALFFLPNQESPSELPVEWRWGLMGISILLFALSEWFHHKARAADRKDHQTLRTSYIATWTLSEVLAVIGLIMTVMFGIQDLAHGLFISSLLLGLWQYPRL